MYYLPFPSWARAPQNPNPTLMLRPPLSHHQHPPSPSVPPTGDEIHLQPPSFESSNSPPQQRRPMKTCSSSSHLRNIDIAIFTLSSPSRRPASWPRRSIEQQPGARESCVLEHRSDDDGWRSSDRNPTTAISTIVSSRFSSVSIFRLLWGRRRGYRESRRPPRVLCSCSKERTPVEISGYWCAFSGEDKCSGEPIFRQVTLEPPLLQFVFFISFPPAACCSSCWTVESVLDGCLTLTPPAATIELPPPPILILIPLLNSIWPISCLFAHENSLYIIYWIVLGWIYGTTASCRRPPPPAGG